MIAMAWDNNAGAGRLVWGPGGLAQDDGLGTCILISLFTDRRVAAEEVVGDQRGWPGDALSPIPGDRIGSRLHLLRREKATDETRLRALDYAAEALEWMRTDGLVSALEIEAEWMTPEMLGMRVTWVANGVPSGPMVIPLRVGLN
jgi:phage gp46-like protein